MINLRDQPISVVGIGKSGFQSALFLKKQGAQVYLTEKVCSSDHEVKCRELEQLGIEVELGEHNYQKLLKSKLVIISPGISPQTEVYRRILAARIPLWSEIELAYRYSQAPIIAVTGTNGKTTVATLITQLLNEQGVFAVSCGNIGNPFIGEVEKLSSKHVAVVEVSSFQLENIDQFRPRVAVLLNLTDNHFDWHGTFLNYANAKWKIFKNQKSGDFSIINQVDVESQSRSKSLNGSVINFGHQFPGNPNFSACLAVVNALGLNTKKAVETLQKFCGIEHRLELVETNDGFRYINDSKSTTISSLKWALERMENPAVVILGGRHKGGDFRQIQETVMRKAKCLILIGEASQEIEEAYRGILPIQRAGSLRDAVQRARLAAQASETILFSPACASFDMFKNYQDRGNQFKEAVKISQSHLNSVNSASIT